MAMSNWKKVVAAGALTLAITVPALGADNDDGGNWGPGWGMGQMMGRWGGWGPGGMMGFYGNDTDAFLGHIDGRLAFLKAELKITEAQTPAWDELAKAIRTSADSHNALMQGTFKMFRNGDFQKMSLPDRLNFQRTHLEARLQQINDVSAAVDKLYGELSDKQKEAADNIVLPMMGMGMMEMGRGFGRGFGPGFGPGMMQSQ